MVVLAHIKEQSPLSLGSYRRPRMTEELKEIGLYVGHRRVGRLMWENGIRVERSKKYKVTTDSNHAFFQDEARVGQQGTLTRIWARRGARPRAPRDTRCKWS